jgi:hypothetical protein
LGYVLSCLGVGLPSAAAFSTNWAWQSEQRPREPIIAESTEIGNKQAGQRMMYWGIADK